jgi:hypothetical protein
MASSQDDLFKEHAVLIARVTIGWNHIQYRILQIFVRLSGLSFEEAKAIIYTLKSDASQRDITIALAKVVLEKRNPDALKMMLKLFDAIGRASGERNAAAHTLWVLFPDDNTIGPHPELPKHHRLTDDHIGQFKDLLNLYYSFERGMVNILFALWMTPLRARLRLTRPVSPRQRSWRHD